MPLATREMYRWAVQDPKPQVQFLSLIHHAATGRWPKRLREDFAGNAADAVEWIAQGGELAVGVDLDRPTLRWGARRAERILGPRAGRLKLLRADVRAIAPPDVPRVDVVSAPNFSACVFHARADMLGYFRGARRGLRPGGVFVMCLFGGPSLMRTGRWPRRVRREALYDVEPFPGPFEYEWEQRSFDAATGVIDCRLHFRAPNGKRKGPWRRNAFRYVCRLWSVPEIKDLLVEAGFRRTEVWQHRRRGRHGAFAKVERLTGDRWVAYVVGVK